MSITSLSAVAASGLSANQARLDTSAHNIANLDTDGFRRQQVVQETQASDGVSTRLRQTDQPGENLAQDLVNQQVALYNFKANIQVLKTGDQVLGSLLDMAA